MRLINTELDSTWQSKQICRRSSIRLTMRRCGWACKTEWCLRTMFQCWSLRRDRTKSKQWSWNNCWKARGSLTWHLHGSINGENDEIKQELSKEFLKRTDWLRYSYAQVYLVPCADTIVDPMTVMIHFLDTSVTDTTMFCLFINFNQYERDWRSWWSVPNPSSRKNKPKTYNIEKKLKIRVGSDIRPASVRAVGSPSLVTTIISIWGTLDSIKTKRKTLSGLGQSSILFNKSSSPLVQKHSEPSKTWLLIRISLKYLKTLSWETQWSYSFESRFTHFLKQPWKSV